ncbi:WXG100 family type VII secretion target [Streptomyces sp. NPDC054841]
MQQVDADQIDAAAAKVNGEKQALDGSYNEMKAVINQLAAAWSGGASDVFEGLMFDWLGDFGLVLNNMQAIGNLLTTSAGEYRAAEDANKQRIARIAGESTPSIIPL